MKCRGVLKAAGTLAALSFCSLNGLAAEPKQASAWTYAGWYGGGMYPSITADPSTEGRLYLTSDVAGMWRSDDRGENWFLINEGLINLNVACSAVAPSNPEVVYAGTSKGLVRSSNAGKTWEDRSHDDLKFKKPHAIKAIAVDYSDPDKVYAGGVSGKIFVSPNGGTKWKEIGSTNDLYGKKAPINYLFITPDGSHLLAGSSAGLAEYDVEKKHWRQLDPAGDGAGYPDAFFERVKRAFFTVSGKRVYWTEDHGRTWKSSNDIPKKEISRIAVTKGKDDKWIFLAGWQDGWKGGVYLSRDSGRSWEDAEKNLEHALDLNPTREWMKSFPRPNFVAIDPFDTEIFYYTDSWGVWRSDDAGKSWKEIIKGAPNMTGSDIAVSEDGTLLVATMDDGILKSGDGGESYKAVIPKADPKAGTMSGHVWRVIPLDGGNFIASASPWHTDRNEIFMGNHVTRDFKRSTKGLPPGYPVKDTFWNRGYPRGLALDSKSGRLYLGLDGDDGGGFYYSEDGGMSWLRPEEQPAFLKIYNGLDVDPETGKIYWAACGDRGGIYSTDAPGNEWKEDFFGQTCFFDLIALPGGVIYASGQEKRPVIYKSKDHGSSWKRLYTFDEGSAAEALAYDSERPEKIFAGVVNWSGEPGGRIYYSPDAGETWQDLSSGLPANSGPAALAVNRKDGMLYALLYAGGIYKRPLSSIYEAGNY